MKFMKPFHLVKAFSERHFSSLAAASKVHQLNRYNFNGTSFYLTPENATTFQSTGKLPFMTTRSLTAIESFQEKMLEKVRMLVKDTVFQGFSLFRILHATRNDLQKSLLHQYASQAWNTDFFLSSLMSGEGSKSVHPDNYPPAELQGLFGEQFGSFENFKKLFTQIANGYFGVGWVWLVCTNNGQELKLIVTHHSGSPFIFPTTSISNAANFMLMIDAKFLEAAVPEQWPILGLSLWEHAFLPCHGTKRELYIDTFWSAVDWQKVLQRLKSSKALAQQD